MKGAISSVELTFYFIIWTGVNFSALYSNYNEQNRILEENPYLLHSLRDLGPGWNVISRYKDYSDVEWATWKYYMKISWFYLVFQFVISETIRSINIPLLKHWYILSTLIFIGIFMGLKQLLIIVMQPIIYATIIFFGGKKTAIWVSSIILLLSYNSLKYKYYLFYFLEHSYLNDEEVYLLLFSVAWIELRCISFCIDYVDKYEKSPHCLTLKWICENMIDMFSYVLYLPVLFVGPMMLYEEFENSFHVTQLKLCERLKRFMFDIVLYLIYSVLMEVAFHYIYFYALQERMDLISQISSLAICGGGLWMGFQFHLKYVISYGTSGAFARLDNFEPPPTPRCIARIHVYSQMWRYFDVGLYKFLVKYIYRPGYSTLSQYISLTKMTYKLVASLCTFSFIFMWHGTVWNIFMWSILNYIGILLEYSAKAISQTEKYKVFKDKWLKTHANEVRFVAIVCTPLLIVSAISNFYLFGGSEVGDLFFSLLRAPAIYNLIIVLIAVYCCCHVSISLQDVPSRTDKKNK